MGYHYLNVKTGKITSPFEDPKRHEQQSVIEELIGLLKKQDARIQALEKRVQGLEEEIRKLDDECAREPEDPWY
jgi:peptidoglycan hydrolase CwlO-like protein